MKIEMKIKSLSFLAIYFFLCTKLFGQIPSLGSFYIIEKNSKENNTQLNLEDNNSILDTTLLSYLTAKKSTFFYNDSIIVNVTSSPFVEEFYTYTYKKNGNIILINRKSKTVVNTNNREYKESIDVFGLMNLDTFDYDTTSFQFLGENCKKISLKDNETNDYYKYITEKISYFSEAYKKRVYIPIQEYSKMLGFETSRRISDIKSDFDSEIFDLDTIGYQKIDIKSWVTNIMGFEVVPDSVYYSKDNIKKYNSIDLNTRDDLNVTDTFFTVTSIIRNLTDRCRKCSINNLLDSIKSNKSIEKGLMLQIQKQYKENSLESIALEFYLSKNLSTKEGRFLLLKNLDFAKIKLHNNESPLSLKEFIDKGYDLSSVISQMKGYNLLEIKLSNLKLKSIFRQLIVIAFPELIKESIKIKERKNAFEIQLGNWNYLVYKPSRNDINDKREVVSYITHEISDLLKQISVDLSQEKLVGVNHYTTMKGGYFFRDFSSNPDTFFVYTLSEKEAPYNTIIGLSFDDSLDIDLQLSLKYIYGDPRNGDNRFMLRNYKTKFKYLTTEQKEKWKLFYINVGNNNKNIKETMFNFAEELSYPLSEVSKMVTFSFEYFLSENDFIPKFYSNNIDTYNKIDTLCTFKNAVPKIYNILNSSLDFENLSLARTSSGQYIIKFTFYDLNFKLVGTLEDVTIKFIKSIDQILASNPKYSYRIYTSYDDNEFYSKYLIMTEQELKIFEEASAVKLVTIY